MSFLDTKTHHAGVLAGIYLVNAVVAPLTLFYAVSDLPNPSNQHLACTTMINKTDIVDCCQR